MATAKQLPSGSWFIRIYDGDLKKQVSFTSQMQGKAGKNEVELMAHEYLVNRKHKKELGKTVGEAIDEYIKLKENILSPTTIEGYRKERRNSLAELCDIYLKDITSNQIQAHFNRLALNKSAKTLHNAHGLLVSVLNVYAPDMRIQTTLPKVQKKIKQLPDVKDVLKAVIGTEIELPCMLAIWGSLRMSEIRGACKSDIVGDTLILHKTVVTVNGEHIKKDSTKTVESTRLVHLSKHIQSLISALPAEQDELTLLSGQAVYKRFVRLLEAKGIRHMTFHDLRHMDASIMSMLNIPEKYAMERGGWSSPHIMKSVYQHTFSAEREAVEQKIDTYFDGLLATILATDSDM